MINSYAAREGRPQASIRDGRQRRRRSISAGSGGLSGGSRHADAGGDPHGSAYFLDRSLYPPTGSFRGPGLTGSARASRPAWRRLVAASDATLVIGAVNPRAAWLVSSPSDSRAPGHPVPRAALLLPAARAGGRSGAGRRRSAPAGGAASRRSRSRRSVAADPDRRRRQPDSARASTSVEARGCSRATRQPAAAPLVRDGAMAARCLGAGIPGFPPAMRRGLRRGFWRAVCDDLCGP
jgi:hypothetical protein